MKHPTKEQLQPLLNAVDTAVWCWAVQSNSKRKGQVDWKSSLKDLTEAWHMYQLTLSDSEAVLSKESK